MKSGLKHIIGTFGLALVFLYSCGKKTENTSGSDKVISSEGLKVAFVYTDSVINNYEYFKKKSEEITEKGEKFDADLQSRAKGFEQEVANFQQTGGSLTQNQIRAKQDELVKKEQNLMTYRNNLMQELSSDETQLMTEVYDQVKAYMDEYASENGIHIILSHTKGGAMWYVDEALDVTPDVTEGLNKKYNAELEASAPAGQEDSDKEK